LILAVAFGLEGLNNAGFTNALEGAWVHGRPVRLKPRVVGALSMAKAN